MSFFYGYVRGNRGTATRCGHKVGGLEVIASSHTSKLEVRYRWIDDEKRAYIEVVIRDAKNGRARTLYDGPEDVLLMDPKVGFAVAGKTTSTPNKPSTSVRAEADEPLPPETVMRGIYTGGIYTGPAGCAIEVWFPGDRTRLSADILASMAESVQNGILKPVAGVRVFTGDRRQIDNIVRVLKHGAIVEIEFRSETDWTLRP